MKNTVIQLSLCILLLVALSACNEQHSTKVASEKEHEHEEDPHKHDEKENDHAHNDEAHKNELLLSQNQVNALGITFDSLKERSMNGVIQVNGSMGVPPQNEAVVTSYIGANISSINAIEGDNIRKGQPLAYISHPDLIQMQTDYFTLKNKLSVLEQNYVRQKKLYDANVGSGKDFQEAEASFLSAKSEVNGFESQLQLIGFSIERLRKGEIAQRAPLRSPINGFVEKVMVKSGQYIQPQTPVFEIVNTEHIHLDLMVFEKDVAKIKNGQKVRFNMESLGGEEMTAKIYAIGKSFEEGPKALHVHAKILNKQKNLIPGMYVNAEIITESSREWALPESAIFQDGDHYYIFQAAKENGGSWAFEPKEILVKFVSNGFTAFALKDPIASGTLIAQSGAYFLMAEMKKSEAEHSH